MKLPETWRYDQPSRQVTPAAVARVMNETVEEMSARIDALRGALTATTDRELRVAIVTELRGLTKRRYIAWFPQP